MRLNINARSLNQMLISRNIVSQKTKLYPVGVLFLPPSLDLVLKELAHKMSSVDIITAEKSFNINKHEYIPAK